MSGQSDDSAFLLDHIESVLRSSLDTYAPESSKTVTIRLQQVWYTPALKSLKSAKRTAETTWRTDKKKIPENRIKYKAAKATYNVALDEAKRSHYISKIKDAIVRPLIKKPSLNSNELKNYRPVSNLSKLLERVVAHRLNSHMQEYGLHEPLQSAYKLGHSTETALLRVHNDILTNMDGQSVTMLIMLDLSAVFDTIDHRVLLDRMESTIGVTGVPLTWFVSYLSEITIRPDQLSSINVQHFTTLWCAARICARTPALSDLHSPSRSYHSLFRLRTSHICR